MLKIEEQNPELKAMIEELRKAAAEDVVEREDGSLVIQLRSPILRKNERIEALTLRRPTAGEILQLDQEAIRREDLASCVGLLSTLSTLSRDEIEGMDGADFVFVANVAVLKFLRRRPGKPARPPG